MNYQALHPDFYNRDPRIVAYELLGKYLIHERSKHAPQLARIVETEAYLGPHDKAAHSAKGRTPRTEVMFGEAGHAYVYLIYGMHHCLNVVTQGPGVASAVLIRALEPLSGIELPTHGPGRLCKALHIDRSLNGKNLSHRPLWIANAPALPHDAVHCGPRIGIDYAQEWVAAPLRYCIKDHPLLSRKTSTTPIMRKLD